MDSTEIIEKIRAEIKIRLSANGAFDEEGDSAWHYDQGLNDAYNYILSVLSDLEKEEKPFKEPIDGVLYAAACGIKNKGQIEKAEKPSEGLEEELKLYCKQYYNYNYPEQEYYDSSPIMPHIIASARHFAQWGRMNLLQEIADGKTHPVDGITAAWLDNTED